MHVPYESRFLDESPRWLIVRGRHQQALRVLQKAGRWNRVALPAEEELYVIMEHIQKEVGNVVNNFD